jgi:replicative DNA helicase
MLSDLPLVKTLPHSEESERAVLGAVLLENDSLADVRLDSNDFYFERHRILYECFCELAADRQPIDTRTVQAHLERIGEFDAVGGLAYIAGLDIDLPDIGRIAAYAEIVKQRAVARALILAAGDLVRNSLDGAQGRSTAAVIEQHAAKIEGIRRELAGVDNAAGFRKLSALLDGPDADYLMGRGHPKLPDNAVATGLAKIDHMTGGLRPGALWVVAARTGVGKTALALQIAAHHACRCGKGTGFVSLEMLSVELLERLAASRAVLNYALVRKRQLTTENRARVARCMREIENAPLHIDDSSGLTAQEIGARVRRLHQQAGAQFVVVDYLGLVRLNGNDREKHYLRLGEVSFEMAHLAKALKIVVMLVVQLSRRNEQERRKPLPSDLADSANIERDAYGLMLLHRESKPDVRAILEPQGCVIIAKHRGGETGEVGVYFDGPTQTFRELTPGEYSA